MKKILLTIVCYIFALHSISAQATIDKPIKKNKINLLLGLESGYLKDINFSPLNYSTNGYALELGYEQQLKNDHLLFFSANALLRGKISSPFSEGFTSARYPWDFELGYLANMPNSLPRTNTRLGGQFHSYLDLVFHQGTESVTFFILHSFDVTGSVSKDIGDKHRIKSSLSLPVFGLLVRPPHTGWDIFIDENGDGNRLRIFFRGDWATLNNFFAFNWNIRYQYALSPHWDLLANYQLRYYRTQVLKTAIIPSNQFTIGTTFKF